MNKTKCDMDKILSTWQVCDIQPEYVAKVDISKRKYTVCTSHLALAVDELMSEFYCAVLVQKVKENKNASNN